MRGDGPKTAGFLVNVCIVVIYLFLTGILLVCRRTLVRAEEGVSYRESEGRPLPAPRGSGLQPRHELLCVI